MRALRIVLLTLVATACSPTTPVVDCVCPALHRVSEVSGAFTLRVASVETLAGPSIATPTSALPVTLAVDESFVTGTVGTATWGQRVDSHVALQPMTGGCCPGPYGVAPNQPVDWRDRDGMRLDASVELGNAFEAFDPTVHVLRSDGLVDLDSPFFSVDATGMTVPIVYFVASPDCADETCASRIRVTYRFDRLGA